MGVLNVTPDSFSDGGRLLDRDDAVAPRRRAARCAAPTSSTSAASRPGPARRGSTPRPRSARVRARDRRPRRGRACAVSVDTTRAAVAAAAIEAGAALVNDVSGGLADPRHGARSSPTPGAVGAHALARPGGRMHELASYEDVIGEVRAELVAQVDARGARRRRPRAAGARPGPRASRRPPRTTGRCCASWTCFIALGFPVLVGASRKRFLGHLLADDDGTPAPARRAATSPPPRSPALAADRGAWGVRVHDVGRVAGRRGGRRGVAPGHLPGPATSGDGAP